MLLLKRYISLAINLKPFTKAGYITTVAQKVKIAKYLLDRTRPAEEILNNLTPSDMEKLELIKREHKHLLELKSAVPSNLKPSNLLELLCCTSVAVRHKLYKHMLVKEKRKEVKLLDKQDKMSVLQYIL